MRRNGLASPASSSVSSSAPKLIRGLTTPPPEPTPAWLNPEPRSPSVRLFAADASAPDTTASCLVALSDPVLSSGAWRFFAACSRRQASRRSRFARFFASASIEDASVIAVGASAFRSLRRPTYYN